MVAAHSLNPSPEHRPLNELFSTSYYRRFREMVLRHRRRSLLNKPHLSPITRSELELRNLDVYSDVPDYSVDPDSHVSDSRFSLSSPPTTDINSNIPMPSLSYDSHSTVMCPSVGLSTLKSVTSPPAGDHPLSQPRPLPTSEIRPRRMSMPTANVSREIAMRSIHQRRRTLSQNVPDSLYRMMPQLTLESQRHPLSLPVRRQSTPSRSSRVQKRRMSQPTSDVHRRKPQSPDVRHRRRSQPASDRRQRERARARRSPPPLKELVASILHRGAGITEIIFKGDSTSASYPVPPKIANKPKQSFQVFMEADSSASASPL